MKSEELEKAALDQLQAQPSSLNTTQRAIVGAVLALAAAIREFPDRWWDRAREDDGYPQ